MTLTTEEPISTTADVRPVLNSWRDEFGEANTASLALRVAFPIVACASLPPFVSPGIALMADVSNLKGGMLEWGEAGLPVER